MIVVTCEPYVLCSKCEDTHPSRCHGTYTCEVADISKADIAEFGRRHAVAQAVRRGGWQILGDEIYCPHCAAVVGKNLLEAAK